MGLTPSILREIGRSEICWDVTMTPTDPISLTSNTSKNPQSLKTEPFCITKQIEIQKSEKQINKTHN